MCPQSTSPEDAFAALGSEPRITILRVLTETEEAGQGCLPFTELYNELEMESTSRLSYHLKHLEGVFVLKTDDGYSLTQAGERVVRAIRSGTYSEKPFFETTEVEGECPTCNATTLVAEYRDRLLAVFCGSCDTTVVTYDLPPAGTHEQSSMDILHSCNRRVHHEYAVALQGTCSMCGGVTETDIQPADGPATYMCAVECNHCRLRLFAPLEVRLLHHPAVISFYWQHDRDILNVRLWELAAILEDWDMEVVETEPFSCQITVSHRGEELRTTLDDQLNVSILN